MEHAKAVGLNGGEVKSISHALKVLNEAAGNSTEALKDMMKKDYKKLQEVLSEVKPELKSAALEMRDTAVQSTKQSIKKVDDTAHESPWRFIGGAAIVSIVIGYLLGRKSKDS